MQYRIRKPYLYSETREMAFWLGYSEGYALFIKVKDSGKDYDIRNESGNS